MSPFTVLIIGIIISGFIAILVKRRELSNSEKKIIRQAVQDYYIDNVQRYDIYNTRWVDVILDYCQDYKINEIKEMKRVFSSFPEDFSFNLVTQEIEI